MRHFLDTQSFAQLASSHELIAVGSPAVLREVVESVSATPKCAFSGLQPFVYGGIWMRYERLLSEVMTYKYRRRSPSFEYRIFRRRWWSGLPVYSNSILLTDEEVSIRSPALASRQRVQTKRCGTWAIRLATRPLGSLPKVSWLQRVRPRAGLREALLSMMSRGVCFAILEVVGRWEQRRAKRFAMEIRRDGIQVLVLLSNAYEPHLRPILRSLRAADVRTLLVVDNWDNLSSKIALPELPDTMGVWGSQTKEHAVDIHGMPPERVFELGSARFIPYSASPKRIQGSLLVAKRVLFAGCSNAYSETPILRFLDERIDDVFPGQLSITYRPHPRRHQRIDGDVFHEENYRHVHLDCDNNGMVTYLRSIGRYQYVDFSLFNFVVSSPTSLSLEAALNGTPVILLATDDGVHPDTASIYLRNSTHFRGFGEIQGVRVANNLVELWDLFSSLASGSPEEGDSFLAHESAEALNRFCRMEFDMFGERLATAVLATLGCSSNGPH